MAFNYLVSRSNENMNIHNDDTDDDFDDESDTTDMDVSTIDHENDTLSYESSDNSEIDENNSTTDCSTEIEVQSELEDEENQNQTKKMKINKSQQLEETESVDTSCMCPICYEAWHNTGNHRLCSLRCGHLFGYKCIQQWFDSNNDSARTCPQCQASASKKHIRFLYANKLACIDNSELNDLKQELKNALERESNAVQALIEEKKKTKRYENMYKFQRVTFITDSDNWISD